MTTAAEKFPLPVERRDFPRSKTLLTRIYDATFKVIRASEVKAK
jgi:hypothetical protein